MKRFASLAVAVGAVSVGIVSLVVPGAASASHARAASTLPTLTVGLTGTTGVTVSSTSVPSGAVSITSTFSGKAPSGPNANGPTVGIARLDPGVTFQQAVGAVQAAHGDPNALQGLGSLIASASAPGTFQTDLSVPGNYVALNATGNNPVAATFTVTQSSSPASLPSPGATERSIEFGFRGASKLHNGELVRFENGGYLVHMDVAFRVANAKAARQAIAALKAGKDKKAFKLVKGAPLSFQGPVSPGGIQQEVVSAKPGVYVQVCFMDTQDGREHTRLGMERMIRITK